MITARSLALDVLNHARTVNAWAGELVDQSLTRSPLTSQDRRLVTQMVFGVIRRRATLDALLRPFVQRPFTEVEPELVDLLRLGAFQIAFLTHIPRHAAVDESVRLTDHLLRGRARGFINGVLRRVAETVTDEFTTKPSSDAVPFEARPDPRFRKLNKPLLPDPEKDAVGYLTLGMSWPKWLAERWHERYGFEECLRLGFWFQRTPALWLRVNAHKLDRETYRLVLAAQGIDAEPGEHPQSLKLLGGAAIRELPGYAAGEFTVQDHSSMLVASAVQPQPGWRVLDLCAAPGGKTTHLAELMRNQGEIVACDVETARLDTVMALAKRLGIRCIKPVVIDKFRGEPPPGPFHAALVDVPCSNTGVLGRRPEVRWRLGPDEFEELVRLQTRLLFQAAERVRPGGVIVYSTCSIEPDENQGVVAGVCRGMRDLTLEAEGPSIPGQPADGGYWARLRKAK